MNASIQIWSLSSIFYILLKESIFENFEKRFFPSIYSVCCRFFPFSFHSFQIQRVRPKRNICKHVLQLKETGN